MPDEYEKTPMEIQLDELEQHFDRFITDQRAKLERDERRRDSRYLLYICVLLCGVIYLILSRLPAREDDGA